MIGLAVVLAYIGAHVLLGVALWVRNGRPRTGIVRARSSSDA